MIRIPWMVKNFVSNHFPLAYHVIANRGHLRQSEAYWDEAFRVSMEAGTRVWPTKNKLITSLTQPGDKILDVGCGTGSTLKNLKQQGYTDLHGVELSLTAVETLEKSGITMTQARLPRIPLPDESFDVVIASQVLEHIVRRRTFAKELRRVTRPGGQVFVFVPDDCLGPIDEPSHVIIYTKERLHRFLRKFFDTVEVTNFRDENFDAPILFAHARRAPNSSTASSDGGKRRD